MELVQKLLLFKKALQTTVRGKRDLETIGRKIVRTKSKIIEPHLISWLRSDGRVLLPATADVISLSAKWAPQLRHQAVVKIREFRLVML